MSIRKRWDIIVAVKRRKEKILGTETLKKQIRDQILDNIIRKAYPVDYILKEKELSDQFVVSKAPVREALIELCKENIVQSIPRAGYRIVQFTERDIREATDLRLILELPVLDAIIPLERKESLDSLWPIAEESNYSKRGEMVPLDIWWDNNIRYHVALSALGGNSLLTSTLEQVIQRLWRVIAQLFWTGNPDNYINFETGNHEALLQAIEKGEKTRAQKILSEDVLSIRDQFPKF
ncbi:MAG: GntR family transcriptional regulator [Treponema sp.]|nr:GntR family transcriptional regulator [Treponema sp.]